ncbi:hypothetical protein [Chryseobacterium fistulae]|uniref:Uncharacterized protein n=1 Tax=Chryseobacterium fistulae TaxID=2675058 RepID=A0A6N4XL97_9FLAO|nr:hypothetical protein [Chryseobacterium fistulae]CAA7386648.1 hypothetical protein CHRY9393_00945 [Chryseobacterium fistulae]
MLRRFSQYLFNLLFVLLTILGLYSGQIQQYLSTNTESTLQSFTFITKQNKQIEKSFAFLKNKDNEAQDQYNISHPFYHKLRANLSENENDNENENVESSGSTEILITLREELWRFISDFVTIYHSKQSAVSLAHSEYIKPNQDNLYIQYRVIRL